MATSTTTGTRRCPMCRVDLDPDGPLPHRPFCSERCRVLDLSRWLRGEYAIPGAPLDGGRLGHDDNDDDEVDW